MTNLERFIMIGLFTVLFLNILCIIFDKYMITDNKISQSTDTIVAIDSALTERLQKQIDSLKIVSENRQSVIEAKTKEVVSLRQRWDAVPKDGDSTIRFADTLIIAQDSLIAEQAKEIKDCATLVDVQDSIIETKANTITQLVTTCNGLEVELNKERHGTWWSRNKAWVGVAVGAIVGASVAAAQ